MIGDNAAGLRVVILQCFEGFDSNTGLFVAAGTAIPPKDPRERRLGFPLTDTVGKTPS